MPLKAGLKYTTLITVIFAFTLSVSALSSACMEEVEGNESQLSPACKEELSLELAEIEKEIEKENERLKSLQVERVSVESDISVLDFNIKAGERDIRARDITIRKLGGNINNIESEVGEIKDDLDEQREVLARLFRRLEEIEETSITGVLFTKVNTLSDFFIQVENYREVYLALGETTLQFERIRKDLEGKQEVLKGQKESQENQRGIRNLQVQNIKENRVEKNTILQVKKDAEEKQIASVTQREQEANRIRTALFRLRQSGPIPFAVALEYAEFAEKATGVRAAFVLGIITQETLLGEFQSNGNWMIDMNPAWRPLFKQLTTDLGLDPDKTPVSKDPGFGWGGALGPAQFIPPTWAAYGGYKKIGNRWVYSRGRDRVAEALGIRSQSSPFIPSHAFLASAMLLKDNGAASSEYCAALRYYSGTCNANSNTAFYPRSVLDHTRRIQKDIGFLKSG